MDNEAVLPYKNDNGHPVLALQLHGYGIQCTMYILQAK